MRTPIHFENQDVLIHPLRPTDLIKFEELSENILEILSDSKTLKFIPEKRLNDINEAEFFLKTMIINFQTNRNYMYFITDKKRGKVIGIIDLITPAVAREYYRMEDHPFFIDFYLGSVSMGSHIMTDVLPAVIETILSQGVTRIGAVINRNNIAARKVLENAQFIYQSPFDVAHDFYETILLPKQER